VEEGQGSRENYPLTIGGDGRRDQHAVCSFHGLPVGPFPLTTTPVPLRKPRARHDLKIAGPHQRRASVCGGQAAFRSGSDSLDATLRSPLHFPARPPQTEALLNVDRDLRRAKTTAKSLRQILGKFACHYFAVGRALLTRLLMLHNPPAKFPICRRHQRVDDASRCPPRCLQQLEHNRPTRCRSQPPWTEALFRFSGCRSVRSCGFSALSASC
jgi:hypothetical protein